MCEFSAILAVYVSVCFISFIKNISVKNTISLIVWTIACHASYGDDSRCSDCMELKFAISTLTHTTQHNPTKQIQTCIAICGLRNTANPEIKLYTGNWIYNSRGKNITSHIFFTNFAKSNWFANMDNFRIFWLLLLFDILVQ